MPRLAASYVDLLIFGTAQDDLHFCGICSPLSEQSSTGVVVGCFYSGSARGGSDQSSKLCGAGSQGITMVKLTVLARLMESTDLMSACSGPDGWEESLLREQWYLPAHSSLERAVHSSPALAFKLVDLGLLHMFLELLSCCLCNGAQNKGLCEQVILCTSPLRAAPQSLAALCLSWTKFQLAFTAR